MDSKKIMLMVPLLVAVVWMGYLVINTQNPDYAARLSPSRLNTLVNSLFFFIIIYIAVLFFVFLKMNKRLHEKSIKKPKKRK